jgi:L-rhamnose isomerase
MFEEAKKRYEALGIDVEAALKTLKATPLSVHCWQGDDVQGFQSDAALSGGIQATGNYPGKARNFAELNKTLKKPFL